jgi:hypothetical protein
MLTAEPVMAALRRAVELCRPRGISVMTIPAPHLSPEFVRELYDLGVNASWFGSDLMFLGQHLRTLVEGAHAQ